MEESKFDETKDFVDVPKEDIFDTDIGCLKPIAINDQYKKFSVSAPMKNGTFITYLVTGIKANNEQF